MNKRRKLQLVFIVILLLSFFTSIGWYRSHNQFSKKLHSELMKHYSSYGTVMSNSLNSYLENYILLWRSAVRNAAFKISLENSNKSYGKLKNRLSYINNIDQDWLTETKDDEVSFAETINKTITSQMLKSIALEFHEEYGVNVFPEVILTNRYGVIVAQTRKSNSFSHDYKKWWQRTIQDGVYVSDIELDEATGANVLKIGIKISDNNGDLLGVLRKSINVQHLTDGLINYDKDILVLNSEQKVIFDSKNPLIEPLSEKFDLENKPINIHDNGLEYYLETKEADSKHDIVEVIKTNKYLKEIKWVMLIRDK